MDKREALRALVADFFEVPRDRVDDAFRLAGPRMQGSVARYALDAGIRRKVGLTSRAVYTATTFGELAAALLDGAAPAPAPPAAPTPPAAAAPPPRALPDRAPMSSPSTRRLAREMGVDLRAVRPTGERGRVTRDDVVQAGQARDAGAAAYASPADLAAALVGAPGAVPLLGGDAPPGMLACGIDIETIDNLPRAPDAWRSDFYQENFARAEIAYCLLQESPPVHFAGRWCAKEALKKCDNALLNERMRDLELARGPSGEVFFLRHRDGATERLPYAVSISHTATTAAAVVVRAPAPAAARVDPAPAPPPSPAPTPPVEAAPAPPAPPRGILGLPRALLGRLLA